MNPYMSHNLVWSRLLTSTTRNLEWLLMAVIGVTIASSIYSLISIVWSVFTGTLNLLTHFFIISSHLISSSQQHVTAAVVRSNHEVDAKHQLCPPPESMTLVSPVIGRRANLVFEGLSSSMLNYPGIEYNYNDVCLTSRPSTFCSVTVSWACGWLKVWSRVTATWLFTIFYSTFCKLQPTRRNQRLVKYGRVYTVCSWKL